LAFILSQEKLCPHFFTQSHPRNFVLCPAFYFKRKNFIAYDKIDKKFLLWFAGMMASDGSIDKTKNNRIYIGQSKNIGKATMEFIKNNLYYTGLMNKYKTISDNMHYSIAFNCEIMLKFLNSLNIYNNKTYSYELPDFTKTQFKYFLQGYIEGDGSITISKNQKNCEYLRVSFVGTEKFIEKISICLKKHFFFESRYRKIKYAKNLCEMYFSGRTAKKFIELIFDEVIYTDGKYSTYIKFLNEVEVHKLYMYYETVKSNIIVEYKTGLTGYQISKKHNYGMSFVYKTIRNFHSSQS
jgi:hypothetical protein